MTNLNILRLGGYASVLASFFDSGVDRLLLFLLGALWLIFSLLASDKGDV